jgi:hypothetical protein
MPRTDTDAKELDALDAISPTTHPGRDATSFRRIIAARKALAAAEAELHAAVDAARAAGDSWTVIGAALDTTRQAAFQRFGEETKKRSRSTRSTAGKGSSSSLGIAAQTGTRGLK